MKFYLLLSLFFFYSLNHAQVALKAITYNIKYDNVEAEVDNWNDRKEAMMVFFQDEDADFIGMQEALVNQLDYIDSGLPSYNYIGVGRDDGVEKGEYCPILYNTDRWKLLDFKTIWLSATPDIVSIGWDAACNRLVTFGKFEHRITGDTLAVFNTHFDHQGEVARKKSVEILSSFVRRVSNGAPSLIFGDFNLEPRDPLYYKLVSHFKDAKKKAYSVHEEHRGTYNGFNTSGNYKRRIDYIFYNKGLEAISYECPDLRVDGRHVSDHFPIIGILQIIEKGG